MQFECAMYTLPGISNFFTSLFTPPPGQVNGPPEGPGLGQKNAVGMAQAQEHIPPLPRFNPGGNHHYIRRTGYGHTNGMDGSSRTKPVLRRSTLSGSGQVEIGGRHFVTQLTERCLRRHQAFMQVAPQREQSVDDSGGPSAAETVPLNGASTFDVADQDQLNNNIVHTTISVISSISTTILWHRPSLCRRRPWRKVRRHRTLAGYGRQR
ncbi:hypothetical protein niasHT_038360 [Heterodera trifolii]|uniref:Uncharacterized protein n=1 Tax=Heterodera trifolii TaxID=157864 RepID=A0ABD2IWL7_9BILA